MKKLIYFLFILTSSQSCKKDLPEPSACISVVNHNVLANAPVVISNCSKTSSSYVWTITGSQGQVSTYNSDKIEDVKITFVTIGLSSVKLEAFSEDLTRRDVAETILDVQ